VGGFETVLNTELETRQLDGTVLAPTSTPANGGLPGLVFLVDFDETLFDSQRFLADIQRFAASVMGLGRSQRFSEAVEAYRMELGDIDSFGGFLQYRREHPLDMDVLAMSRFLFDYPYRMRLYQQALAAIELLKSWGTAVILSDGDIVFQLLKIDRSGVWSAVYGNVLIYPHKEQALDDVLARFPADHYVLLDDNLQLLQAVKAAWKDRVTTVHICHALPHDAEDSAVTPAYPAADLCIPSIGEVFALERAELTGQRQAVPVG
jgi:FMN phosphatase YigB (HAD superfamily)